MKINGKYLSGILVVSLAITAFPACATRNSQFVDADKLYQDARYDQAANLLESKESDGVYPDSDKVLRLLDVGILRHLAMESAKSNANLEEAESLIAEYYTKSLTEAAGSYILNDNVLTYGGEDYENIYLNVFKALNYARMGSFDGAWVEIRRMGEKLLSLQDRYERMAQEMNGSGKAQNVRPGESRFRSSALAHYLSMVLYRADGRLDDAALEFKAIKNAFSTQPEIYPFPAPDLEDALASREARLSMVIFTGRSPEKRARTWRLGTGSGFVTVTQEQENDSGRMEVSTAISLPAPGVKSGYNFKCQVPWLSPVDSALARVQILQAGALIGECQVIEDLSLVALDTFKAREPIVFTKTIIRTAIKGILAVEAKEEIRKAANNKIGGIGGQLLGALGSKGTDALVEASETADLRSGRYFPGKAWVLDRPANPGAMELTVRFLDVRGTVLGEHVLAPTEIKSRGLNLLSYAVKL